MITALQLALETELHIKNIPFTFTKGKTHPSLNFELNGKEKRFIFAATPSDNRGYENAVHDLRRILSVISPLSSNIRASLVKQSGGVRLRLAFTQAIADKMGDRINISRTNGTITLRPGIHGVGFKIQKIPHSKTITNFVIAAIKHFDLKSQGQKTKTLPLIWKNKRATFTIPTLWDQPLGIQPTPLPVEAIAAPPVPASVDTLIGLTAKTLNDLLKENPEFKVVLSENPFRVHIHKVVKIT